MKATPVIARTFSFNFPFLFGFKLGLFLPLLPKGSAPVCCKLSSVPLFFFLPAFHSSPFPLKRPPPPTPFLPPDFSSSILSLSASERPLIIEPPPLMMVHRCCCLTVPLTLLRVFPLILSDFPFPLPTTTLRNSVSDEIICTLPPGLLLHLQNFLQSTIRFHDILRSA